MLKVLIVDDEPLAIEYVKSIIKWCELGLEVIGEAENGLEAISIINNTHPDIILLDLVMPEMEGLQLAKFIKENKLNIAIIVISGMDRFDYASESIKLDVKKYLLKPFDVKELEDMLIEVSNNIMYTRINTEEKRTLLLNNIFHNINGKNTYSNLDSFKISKFYNVCIAFYKKNESINKNIKRLQNHLLTYPYEVIYMKEGQKLICTFLTDVLLDYKKIFIEYINHYPCLNNSISIAIGQPVDNFKALDQSYEYAQKVLSNGILYQINGILDWKDTLLKYSLEITKAEKIIKLLRTKDLVVLNSEIDSVFKEMMEVNATYFDVVKISNELISLCDLVLKNKKNNILANENNFTEFDYSHFIMCVKDYYKHSLNNSFSFLSKQQNIANIVKEIVDQNYMNEDLDIKFIESKVFVNSSYIRRSFKECMDVTINNYLIQVRIERAKELIYLKKYKYADIAEMVGYKDCGYFSKSFKQLVGLSPKEYELTI